MNTSLYSLVLIDFLQSLVFVINILRGKIKKCTPPLVLECYQQQQTTGTRKEAQTSQHVPWGGSLLSLGIS